MQNIRATWWVLWVPWGSPRSSFRWVRAETSLWALCWTRQRAQCEPGLKQLTTILMFIMVPGFRYITVITILLCRSLRFIGVHKGQDWFHQMAYRKTYYTVGFWGTLFSDKAIEIKWLGILLILSFRIDSCTITTLSPRVKLVLRRTCPGLCSSSHGRWNQLTGHGWAGDLEKGIHGIVCPYLSMSTINLRDFGSFSWWQIGGYGSDICDSNADGTELGSRSFWRTAILWTQLLLWLLETTDFRPGANAESVPVPRKYPCLLSDSNKGGSWPEAVINDRLPMMDEVERGFKEKYEARSCVEFLGQWGCHMWSVSKKTVHPQV